MRQENISALIRNMLMAAGLIFLYIPIVVLMIYSFNASRLVTVWAGFSGKWYSALLRNEQIISAAWKSVFVALCTASLAVVFGTLAGFALVRYSRFRGRSLLVAMTTAPLIMPEVITGISLLLLFVSLEQFIGWPQGRSLLTIIIAHTTFATAYVAIVVQARLRVYDQTLEEAAFDLGAREWKVFFYITLPLIFPGLLAGWLLSFTLSLDDLVIASFVSGPRSTTLPMVVFSSVRLGVSPEINALATLLILLVALSLLAAWWSHARLRRSIPG